MRSLSASVRALGAALHRQVNRWRTGSRAGQLTALAGLVVGVVLSAAVSLHDYSLMPVTAFVVWLLLGMLLLRFWPLVVLVVVCVAAGTAAVSAVGPLTQARISAMIALLVAVAVVLYQSRRQRSGLPGPLSEAMLSDLRDRLQRQGRVPALPPGWHADSATVAADGGGYAGDFLVADLHEDGEMLELILVDVCGKGVAAATQALQFAGALGGLLGAVEPRALMHAANRFLLRLPGEENLATAVYVRLDLRDGAYVIASAGHPPALRYCSRTGRWQVDGAAGTALGVTDLAELATSEGRLAPGEALLFYTDGVVESRERELDEGIERLAQEAGRELDRLGSRPGAALGAGLARRLLRRVGADAHDDRSILVLSRVGAGDGGDAATPVDAAGE